MKIQTVVENVVEMNLEDWVKTFYDKKGLAVNCYLKDNKWTHNSYSFLLPPGNTDWMMKLLEIIQEIVEVLKNNQHGYFVNSQVIDNSGYLTIFFDNYSSVKKTLRIKH